MEQPGISEAESAVMEILWEHSPLSAEQIVAALPAQRAWQASTVKSLLNRLLKKGAIRAEQEGRRYLYSPVLAREDWVLEESRSLLDRLFGGNITPLVAHFGKHRRLKKDDLAQLRRLIDQIDDSGDGSDRSDRSDKDEAGDGR